MSIFSPDVYERLRTRVVVVHAATMLLLPPGPDDDGAWHPPGGGLAPDESLAECAAREVFEETGVRVRVGHVAFTREWVAPKYCTPEESGDGPGYGLEVFFYAVPEGTRCRRARQHRAPRPMICRVRAGCRCPACRRCDCGRTS